MLEKLSEKHRKRLIKVPFFSHIPNKFQPKFALCKKKKDLTKQRTYDFLVSSKTLSDNPSWHVLYLSIVMSISLIFELMTHCHQSSLKQGRWLVRSIIRFFFTEKKCLIRWMSRAWCQKPLKMASILGSTWLKLTIDLKRYFFVWFKLFFEVFSKISHVDRFGAKRYFK